MQILSITAVLVNVGVVIFITDWIPSSWLNLKWRWITFVVCEHVFVMSKILYEWLTPDTPLEVGT